MKKLTPAKQYLLGFVLVFIALLIAIVTVFYSAMKPRLTAEKSATQTAVAYAKLTATTDFDIYNGADTYYSVFGTTEDGTKQVVLIGKDNADIYIYNLSDGISRKKAKAAAKANGATDVGEVTFGMSDSTPIWEVAADNGYYLVNFETGELVKKEGI